MLTVGQRWLLEFSFNAGSYRLIESSRKLETASIVQCWQYPCKTGGELGIRTLDTLMAYTRLAGEHLRPLGQLSVDTETILILKYGAKRNDTFTERFLQGGC